MKQYTLRFETNIIEKKGTTVRLTREAQLSCGDETILTDIKNFLDNVKLIYKEIQKCYKEGRFCELLGKASQNLPSFHFQLQFSVCSHIRRKDC